MRRLFVVIAVACLSPTVAQAQPQLMVGIGATAPMGDVSDIADPGYHGNVGLLLALPSLPIGLRGDGTLHQLGSAVEGFDGTQVLAGSLSLVYTLPGIGMEPYLLAGWGQYRVESGPEDLTEVETDPGFHGGFGVALAGVGAFAEIRYIRIDGAMSGGLIPLTIGFRL